MIHQGKSTVPKQQVPHRNDTQKVASSSSVAALLFTIALMPYQQENVPNPPLARFGLQRLALCALSTVVNPSLARMLSYVGFRVLQGEAVLIRLLPRWTRLHTTRHWRDLGQSTRLCVWVHLAMLIPE